MCIIEGNYIPRMFSRVPQLVNVGLVREKTHSYAVSRKDKSLGETVFNSYLLGFFFFMGNNKIGGVI